MHHPMRTGTAAGAWLIAALALGALGGCGSGSGPAAGAAGGAAKVAHKAAPVNGVSPGMVSGVTAPGAGPQSVQVKFELREKPEVAQPLDVDLVIVPVYGDLERITGKIVGDDGLEMVSGQELPAMQKPVEGTAIHHSVQVRPKRDGVFNLSAVLLVDSANQSTSQTFSIPVIAGSGEAENAPARTASAAGPTPGTPAPSSPQTKSIRPSPPAAAAQ
jgi:hypothetical protein